MRALLVKTSVAIAIFGSIACGSRSGPTADAGAQDATAEVDADAQVAVAPPPVIDAEQAWASHAIQTLLGRKPHGIAEVRAVADLVHASDRATVATGLMRAPEFVPRWTEWVLDELQVTRNFRVKLNPGCWQTPLQSADTGQIAAFLRDHPPTETSPAGDFNMADVVRSSLLLDDLTPIFRANLMAMMARPTMYCGGESLQQNDDQRRIDLGRIFANVYTHRTTDCLQCHNSESSVTYSADPTVNRFWPIAGYFEKALYGDSAGRPEEEIVSLFRVLGVVGDADNANNGGPAVGNVQAWGSDVACGTFNSPAAVTPDPLNVSGYFGGELGPTASIWDVEKLLHQGIDALRAGGVVVGAQAGDLPPDVSFGYLLSVRIAHQLWLEVFGAPLTIAHGFPRNEAQRDRLQELTGTLIASGWSLRAVLRDIVLDPYFVVSAPAGGTTGVGATYGWPALFDPWSFNNDDPTQRGNSAGDVVHRVDARGLLTSVEMAMGWPAGRTFALDGAESEFQSALGIFQSDDQPARIGLDFGGMLAWENRFGACTAPVETIQDDFPFPGTDQTSCAGRCDSPGFGQCGCDADCVYTADCCQDFKALCVLASSGPPAPDWLDALGAAAVAYQAAHPADPLLLRDVAVALKDRLVSRPDIEPVLEAPAVATLFGASSLDVPLSDQTDWKSGARAFCGVLLKSPQFMTDGLAAPKQLETPRLHVGATGCSDECNRLAALIFDPAHFDVVCTDTSASVQAKAP